MVRSVGRRRTKKPALPLCRSNQRSPGSRTWSASVDRCPCSPAQSRRRSAPIQLPTWCQTAHPRQNPPYRRRSRPTNSARRAQPGSLRRHDDFGGARRERIFEEHQRRDAEIANSVKKLDKTIEHEGSFKAGRDSLNMLLERLGIKREGYLEPSARPRKAFDTTIMRLRDFANDRQAETGS